MNKTRVIFINEKKEEYKFDCLENLLDFLGENIYFKYYLLLNNKIINDNIVVEENYIILNDNKIEVNNKIEIMNLLKVPYNNVIYYFKFREKYKNCYFILTKYDKLSKEEKRIKWNNYQKKYKMERYKKYGHQ